MRYRLTSEIGENRERGINTPQVPPLAPACTINDYQLRVYPFTGLAR